MTKKADEGNRYRNGVTPADDPKEVASYVASLTTELTEMARSARLPALVYFLDMARHEALSIAGREAAEPVRRAGSSN